MDFKLIQVHSIARHIVPAASAKGNPIFMVVAHLRETSVARTIIDADSLFTRKFASYFDLHQFLS